MEDSSSVLLSCAACPSLIELQLGYNYLTEFVPDAVAEDRFPRSVSGAGSIRVV